MRKLPQSVIKRILGTGKLVLLSMFASACVAKTVVVTEGLSVEVHEDVKGSYKFAHGFGLIYGPMPVARYLGVVEKMFPNADIQWQNIFTTSQQRDAMLSGNLDFGSCTPGPFLQAWDRGVDWRWLQTTSGFDGYLMARPDGPGQVEDFIDTQKKMSPGPNTAQYFAIQEYLKQAGKDVHVLDRNWANLPHPDAMQALIAGQLDGHFATGDFAMRLEEQGMKKLTSIHDIYGSFYPVGACALQKTISGHPELAAGYAQALRKVADWMNANPGKAAVELSKSTGGKESAENFEKYLKSSVYKTFTKDANLQAYGKSLHELGAIRKVPAAASDIYAFPDQAGGEW